MQKEKFNKTYDVFHAFLVEDAEYDGRIELPCFKTSLELPNRLIPFSKAMEQANTDFNQWVMFYERDLKFMRVWNNPKKYLDRLKKFKGLISPDFSLYRNMPLVMPKDVLVHGFMPDSVFGEFLKDTNFHRYKSWFERTHEKAV